MIKLKDLLFEAGGESAGSLELLSTSVAKAREFARKKNFNLDKEMTNFEVNYKKGSKNFIQNKSFFVVSGDNFIIDGHHRFLSALLIDPNMKINALSIDLPIKKLLPPNNP